MLILVVLTDIEGLKSIHITMLLNSHAADKVTLDVDVVRVSVNHAYDEITTCNINIPLLCVHVVDFDYVSDKILIDSLTLKPHIYVIYQDCKESKRKHSFQIFAH